MIDIHSIQCNLGSITNIRHSRPPIKLNTYLNVWSSLSGVSTVTFSLMTYVARVGLFKDAIIDFSGHNYNAAMNN
jgi:hypothetical protein